MAIATGLALAGAAAASAAAGVVGASKQAKAAKDAAKEQKEAAQSAQQLSKQMYDTTREDLAPYRNLGTEAKGKLFDLLGLGKGGSAGIQTALESTPGYQFTRDQSLKAVQNGFAAKGLGTSGAAMKGAADYASGLASSTYFQTIPNYLQLVTMGGNAAAQTGTLGAQSTQMINSAGTNAAAAGAAGTIGAANAWSGGLNTAASGLSNAFMTNAMFKQLAAG